MKNLVQLDFAHNRAFVVCDDMETGDETKVEIDLDCVKIVDAATDGWWYVIRTNPKARTRYCMTHVNGRTLYQHRLLCRDIAPDLHAAHLNHDGLCNRRDNLKALTPSAHNKLDAHAHCRPKTNNLVGVRGVQKRGKKYRAICLHKHLGMFPTLKEAENAVVTYRQNIYNERKAAL